MLRKNSRHMLYHPLLGAVYFDERFWQILELPYFFNLKFLSQLGPLQFAPEFVAPSRNRLQHSVGVYAIMSHLINMLYSFFIKFPSFEKAMDALLLAALGHDIGHCSFCHGLEHREQVTHEERTIKLFLENKDTINNIFGYDIVSIVVFLLGKKDSQIDSEIYDLCHALRIFIDGPIDCDRLEYVRTDGWTLFGRNIDYQSVFDYMVLSSKDDTPSVSYSYDGVGSIEEFLIARRHLYIKGYYSNPIMLLEMILREYQRFCLSKSVDITQMSEAQIVSKLGELADDESATLFERRCGQIFVQGSRSNLLFKRFDNAEKYYQFLAKLKEVVSPSLIWTYEKLIITYKGGILVTLPDEEVVDLKKVSPIACLPNLPLYFVMVDLELGQFSSIEEKYVRKLF